MRNKEGQHKRHILNCSRTNKEELQQKNGFGTVSRKSSWGGGGGVGGGGGGGVCVCGGGGGGVVKPVLFARNIAHNSDAVPNY